MGDQEIAENAVSQASGSSLVGSGPETLGSVLDLLRAIPEEQLWLEGQRSPATRRAYASDVVGFMRFFGITTTDELRRLDRGAVLAWKRALEVSDTKPTTIRRKLAALSSLLAHLVHHQVLRENLCREIARPRVNARRGTTAAFSAAQARAILDAPDPETLQGLRDRALLSVGFQAGPRRSSIVRLRVRDFHQDAGFDCLRFVWKGGHEHAVALHPQTGQRIRDYLAASGHGGEGESPLFLTVRGEGPPRGLTDQQVGRILAHYVRLLGIEGRFSAHSMQATFVTTALANGASLEDMQEAVGHADPSTTKLYDRRGYNPEKSAAFFANY